MSKEFQQLKKYQHSSSKRKTLAEGCALKYYHRYVAKTYPFTSTPAIEVGNIADTVLEEAILTGVDPDLTKLRKDIVHAHPEYKFLDALVEGVDAAFEYAITRTGLRVMQQWMAVDKTIKPCEPSWRGSKLFDACKMDLLTIDSPTHAFVDDWKTGNPRYPDMNQLEDYAMYVFALYPSIQEVTGSLVWLREGRHDTDLVHKKTLEFKRKGVTTTVKRWANHHRRVIEFNNARDWPAVPSRDAMCAWCDHLNQCEAGQDYVENS